MSSRACDLQRLSSIIGLLEIKMHRLGKGGIEFSSAWSTISSSIDLNISPSIVELLRLRTIEEMLLEMRLNTSSFVCFWKLAVLVKAFFCNNTLWECFSSKLPAVEVEKRSEVQMYNFHNIHLYKLDSTPSRSVCSRRFREIHFHLPNLQFHSSVGDLAAQLVRTGTSLYE